MRSEGDPEPAERGNEDTARRHQRRGDSARKVTAAARILIAVILAVCGVVGMRGTRLAAQGVVVGAVLTFIRYHDAYRSTCGLSVNHAADDAEMIRLAPRGICGGGGAAF